MKLENDAWNNIEFDAFYGKEAHSARARYLQGWVRVAHLIGAVGFVSGLLTFARDPSPASIWLSGSLLGAGILAFIIIQQMRTDLLAKEHQSLAGLYAQIVSEHRGLEPSERNARALRKRLTTLLAKVAEMNMPRRGARAALIMNQWLDYCDMAEGRCKVRWYERALADARHFEPAKGWTSRRSQ